jgi:hypothetical protein
MRAILIVLAMMGTQALMSQDVIFLHSGEEIRGRVMEIGVSTISYKKLEKPDGPVYKIEKEKVAMIRYKDGSEETFTSAETGKPKQTDIDFFIKGQRDADRFYQDYKTAGTATLIVSLLSPLVGLVPAIATSATPPKEINLGYPDSELYGINDYKRGYQLRAKKIKSRKVWTNWGVALGVNFILVLLFAAGQ